MTSTLSRSLSPGAVLSTVAPVSEWPMLRELGSGPAQRVFHELMSAFARPGLVRQLPADALTAGVPAAVVPLLTLADLMAPIAALETPGQPTAEAIAVLARLTGAPIVGPDEARLALALAEPADWADLCRGSHTDPERGALLVQRVSGYEPGDRWRLSGPGIAPIEPVTITVGSLSEDWLDRRSELTSDYPTGVDCLLVDDTGAICALPRTTRIEVA